jgi:hypothetical protein
MNRTLPSRKQMEEIALIIPTEAKRKVGGFTGMGFTTEEPEEEVNSIME